MVNTEPKGKLTMTTERIRELHQDALDLESMTDLMVSAVQGVEICGVDAEPGPRPGHYYVNGRGLLWLAYKIYQQASSLQFALRALDNEAADEHGKRPMLLVKDSEQEGA